MNTAKQIVTILEKRGVKYVFGLPGEENISLVNELNKSEKIQFVLVHDENSAAFMAAAIGWLTDQPGVAVSTLGPGALNMTLGAADAQSHSAPMIAIAAQSSLKDVIKESTQVVDLKNVFAPITKWSENLYSPESTVELINKAYNTAVNGRPGAVFVAIPADFEQEETGDSPLDVIENPKEASVPSGETVMEAARLIKEAEQPVLLIGLGAVREKSSEALRKFVKKHNISAASTFMAKGAVPDDSEYSLGTVGFFVEDYSNQVFYESDLIITAGYEFTEFDPEEINPKGDKKIIHIHSFNQDTDKNYSVSANLTGSIPESIKLLSEALNDFKAPDFENTVRKKIDSEFEAGSKNTAAPLSPAQVIHATRRALAEQGTALVDTGAVKIWMARLFPTYEPNSVLINNGMSSMSWSIPAAIVVKIVYPEKPILTVIGDGSFHMSVQEIATARRYNIPMTILVWDDSGYGLIKWKMDMSLGEHAEVDFENPDFIKIAEAYGGKAYRAESRDDLEQKLKKSLEADKGIDIIVAPVDYSHNMELTERLQDELE